MKLPNLTEAQQFSPEILEELFKNTDEIRSNLLSHRTDLSGKILATLFYEPSTRTRLSFEAAMLRLGGEVLTTENAAEFSSAVKGESIEDTARIVAGYADAIIVRHKEEGIAKKAADVVSIPVINAGDGKGQHPTQALLDLYTINREVGLINGIKIAMVGDLASGRTVRSLCYLLGKFDNISTVFVSPENLRIGEDIKDYLTKHQVGITEETDLEKVLPDVDVVYMTRIQKERISTQEYERAKGRYVIDDTRLKMMKPSARLLHPLPHVEEIDLHIDVENLDPRVAYFRQAQNGMYVRMALLNHLLK